MISSEILHNLRTGFSNLKETATSDTDVCDWFKQNTNFIPNLPSIYQAKVTVQRTRGMTAADPNLDTPGIVHWLTLEVHAEIPNYADAILEEELFERLTGVEVRTRFLSNLPLAFKTEFTLSLLGTEWRYVAADAAYLALTSKSNNYSEFKEYAKRDWGTAFPDRDWSTLENLEELGLLPSNAYEFVVSVVTKNTIAKNQTFLPLDLSN